jgi:hypothetical protein
MEENDDISDNDLYVLQKLMDTMLVFNSHFAHYIREYDKDLFKRAVDYAKTFTEEDVSGIILSYSEEEEEDDGRKDTGT